MRLTRSIIEAGCWVLTLSLVDEEDEEDEEDEAGKEREAG